MTQQVSFGFKISGQDRDVANRIIKEIMDIKDLKKGEALMYILKSHESGDTSHQSITTTETLSKIECPYISYNDNKMMFECLETVAKKREPKELSADPLRTIKLCKAHLLKLDELEAHRRKKLFEKASMQKLLKFMNQFRKISGKGIEFDVHMCLAQFLQGKIGVSYDGETMLCPEQSIEDDEESEVLVNIKGYCMTLINDPSKQTPPCRYLVYTPRKVIITEETLKEAGIDVPLKEDELKRLENN